MALQEPDLNAWAPFWGQPLPGHRDSAPPQGSREDDFLAAYFFPELAEWRPILDRLGLPLETAVQLAARANVNATGFQAELMASGIVGETELFRAFATELGLPFVSSIDPARLIIRETDCLTLLRRSGLHVPVKIEDRDGAVSFLVAPGGKSVGSLRKLLAGRPRVAGRLKVTAPGLLRAAVLERARPLLARRATGDLFDRHPAYSARIVANAWQGSVWGAALVALPVAVAVAPTRALGALHGFFSFFFLACIGLRFAAIQSPAADRGTLKPSAPADLPVYSVLVALYDEAEVVPELLAALTRLD